jgi:hypothetical protein
MLQCAQGQIVCVVVIQPGDLPEVCDGVDNDCDGAIDEGLPLKTFFLDADGDSFGGTTTMQACAPPEGYTDKGKDCDDDDPAVYPGAPEVCNNVDDNCNGVADEGIQKPTFYRDNDGDGFGGPLTILACSAPQGYAEAGGDCNDLNPKIHPDAAEECDGVDNNCNGVVDEGLPLVDVYNDLDGDGFGAKNALPKKFCLQVEGVPPQGYSFNKDDCDDSKATVHPGARELCDGVLNNCNLKVADYQCPTKCPGSWPVAIGGAQGYVAFAQLDNDAEWEVVAQQGGSTYVIEHDGTIKWKGTGTSYSYPSFGDFNQDGILDLAVPNTGKVLLLNGATGAQIASVNSPSAMHVYGASILDLDGDGWPDVAPVAKENLDLLFLGKNGQLLASRSLAPLPEESGFFHAKSAFFDLDGDGFAEMFGATSSWQCKGNLPGCQGRFFAFRQDGSRYNDPSWTDPTKPWFQVDKFPESFGGEGYFQVVADFDHDGTPEIYQPMTAEGAMWSFDGAKHPLSGAFGVHRIFAPVTPEGQLTDGQLNPVDKAVVDLEGDGKYELIGSIPGGFGILQDGEPMDGYPITINGTWPTVTDLNRDGALSLLWIGANNAVNCWKLKGSTYDPGRVLHAGGLVAPGTPGVYPTGSHDAFEPNQPSVEVDPKTSTNPAGDFRAFLPFGLRDKFISGGGWEHNLRATIGRQGDSDYYWFANTYSRITLLSTVAEKLKLDLDVFVYEQQGGAWSYVCEAHLDNTAEGDLYIHPTVATGTCPSGYLSTRGFLVRVKGHDAAKDHGPWPYSLSFRWKLTRRRPCRRWRPRCPSARWCG